MSENGNTSNYDPKVVSIVCYITLIGWIVAVVMNNPKSELGSFHIRQMLGLVVISLGLWLVNFVPILGQIVWVLGSLGVLVLWILGLISATKGEQTPLPVVGEYFQEWFKGL